MSTLLRVDAIEVGYGDLTAVGDVSLEVREGETVALIGANGAGKTTTLRAVSGLLPLRRGRIEFEGQRLDGLTSAQIVARGIAPDPANVTGRPTSGRRGASSGASVGMGGSRSNLMMALPEHRVDTIHITIRSTREDAIEPAEEARRVRLVRVREQEGAQRRRERERHEPG